MQSDQARVIDHGEGFEGVYVSLSEVVHRAGQVAGVTDLPVLADAGKGGRDLPRRHGEPSGGVRIVIYPVSLLRLAMGVAERGLDELLAAGTFAGHVGDMQTRARLYDLVDYADYAELDNDVYDFDV